MSRLGFVLVVLAAAAAPTAGADKPSPDPKDLVISAADRAKAADLVRRLGSDEFREREAAERDLAGMGRRARPALAAAAGTDPSPEVRVRVGRLLPKAEAADRKARLEAFAADADGKFDHDLPGWAAFAKHVGKDPAARELFAELAREPANLSLLAAAGGPKEAAGRAVADRRLALYVQQYPQLANRLAGSAQGRSQPPSVPDLTALFLAEVVVPGEEVWRHGSANFATAGSFLSTSAAAAVAVHTPDAKHGPAFRKLIGVWLDTRTDPADLSAAVQVAQGLAQFPQTVPLFRRAAATAGVQGFVRGQAIGYLTQRQGAAAAPFFRGLLADEAPASVVWLGNNPQGVAIQATCLVKDVALAALVLQGGETLKSYGFDTAPGQGANQLNTLQSGGITFAFTTDEKRAAAFKRWAEREATGKVPPPLPPPPEPAPPPRLKK